MGASQKISYAALLKYLQDQVDRRYRHYDSGLIPSKKQVAIRIEQVVHLDGKSEPVPDNPVIVAADVRALEDDWFNLTRLLDSPAIQAALKQLCEGKHLSTDTKKVQVFLEDAADENGDILYEWTRERSLKELARLVAIYAGLHSFAVRADTESFKFHQWEVSPTFDRVTRFKSDKKRKRIWLLSPHLSPLYEYVCRTPHREFQSTELIKAARSEMARRVFTQLFKNHPDLLELTFCKCKRPGFWRLNTE